MSLIGRTKAIRKGFTLVEIIVVISILAILATIAFVAFSDYTKNARDSVRIGDIAGIKQGLHVFDKQNGEYPAPSGTVKNVVYSGQLAFVE